MTITAHIVFTPSDDSPAPLFCQYAGQVQPQPAYVTLDTRTGEVDADYDGNIGNSMPMNVWEGIVRRYRIRNDLTNEQIMDVLTESLQRFQQILDAPDSESMSDLEFELERELPLGAEEEPLVITDLAEWIQASGDRACWVPAKDETVDQFVADFDLDGKTATEDIRDVLMDIWASELYSGEVLQQNVAQALLDDGRCEDSQWMEELRANARGEVHENQEN